jgi:hypothetical protein
LHNIIKIADTLGADPGDLVAVLTVAAPVGTYESE